MIIFSPSHGNPNTQVWFFLLSCCVPGWQAGFGYGHHVGVWFVLQRHHCRAQADCCWCSISKEKGEFHDRSREWSFFIYFAVIFLKEAFQGSFYTVFVEFTTLAQLLSLRSASSLRWLLFSCPKFRSLASSIRPCPACYCSSAFQEWKSPSWLYTGESKLPFLSVQYWTSFSSQPEPAARSRHVAVPSLLLLGLQEAVLFPGSFSLLFLCSPFSKCIWPQQF